MTDYDSQSSQGSSDAHPPGGHERTDVSASGVVWTAAGLAIMVIVSVLISAGVFAVLMQRTEQGRPSVTPLLSDETQPPLPAQPRLEGIDRAARIDARPDQRDEKLLHQFGWVDKPKGVVHVPIAVAMQRLLDSKSLKTEEGVTHTWKDAGTVIPTGAASGRGQEGEQR